MSWTVAGIVTIVRPSPAKASLPIVVREVAGVRSTVVKSGFSEKAPVPKLTKSAGNWTFVTPLTYLKASLPIVVTLFGNVICVNPVPTNAWLPTVVKA